MLANFTKITDEDWEECGAGWAAGPFKHGRHRYDVCIDLFPEEELFGGIPTPGSWYVKIHILYLPEQPGGKTILNPAPIWSKMGDDPHSLLEAVEREVKEVLAGKYEKEIARQIGLAACGSLFAPSEN